MQNPNKKVNPVFKAEYNIYKRVKKDEQMRNYSEYAQR